MNESPAHQHLALDAIEAANSAGPEESEAGQVYAQVAVAEAVLAVFDVLIDIRDNLEALPARLNK
jgi:hypothetical protein